MDNESHIPGWIFNLNLIYIKKQTFKLGAPATFEAGQQVSATVTVSDFGRCLPSYHILIY